MISATDLEYQIAKGSRRVFFDYAASEHFCREIGLLWLGEDFVIAADLDAWLHGFTQEQVDIAMRHHLWQVKFLFTPRTYSWRQRILLAFHFLTGWRLK